MKKAQISIFVIIAVIIIVATGILVLIASQNNSKNLEKDLNTNPSTANSLKGLVDSCVEQVSQEAILEVAFTGGYHPLTEDFVDYYDLKIPIYLSNNKIEFPSIIRVEDSMTYYFNEHFENCIQNISDSDLGTFTYDENSIESDFDITEDSVEVDVEFDVSISDNDKTISYKNFKFSHNDNFFKLYNLSNEFIDMQTQDPHYILTSKLVDFSKENDVKIELINFDSDTVIYSFVLEEFGRQMIYNFAVDYEWEEIEI